MWRLLILLALVSLLGGCADEGVGSSPMVKAPPSSRTHAAAKHQSSPTAQHKGPLPVQATAQGSPGYRDVEKRANRAAARSAVAVRGNSSAADATASEPASSTPGPATPARTAGDAAPPAGEVDAAVVAQWLPVTPFVPRGARPYAGAGEEKAYRAQVIGRDEQHTAPDGTHYRAVLMALGDGSQGWKGLDGICASASFFLRADDPALQAPNQ